jgi:hypothetical protein
MVEQRPLPGTAGEGRKKGMQGQNGLALRIASRYHPSIRNEVNASLPENRSANCGFSFRAFQKALRSSF